MVSVRVKLSYAHGVLPVAMSIRLSRTDLAVQVCAALSWIAAGTVVLADAAVALSAMPARASGAAVAAIMVRIRMVTPSVGMRSGLLNNVNGESKSFSAAIRPNSAAIYGQIAQRPVEWPSCLT